MTRAAVEFIDPAGNALDDTAALLRGPTRFQLAILRFGPALGWLTAAVLAIVAPFHKVYTASFSASGPVQSVTVDGWGRESLTGGFGEHSTRIGIITVVAATVLAALIGGYLWHLWRYRAPEVALNRLLTAAAVAAPTVLASAAVALWLITESVFASYRAQNRLQNSISTDQQSVNSLAIHWQLGSALWLILVATGFASAASVTYLWPHHSARAEEVRPLVAAPTDGVPPDGTELLD